MASGVFEHLDICRCPPARAAILNDPTSKTPAAGSTYNPMLLDMLMTDLRAGWLFARGQGLR